LSAELDDVLALAAIDPPPGTSARAYRFTSRRALAVWLLGGWLRHGGTVPADVAAVAAQLCGGDVPGWARREVFGDGRTLPAVLAGLARHGLAAALFARLDPADVARIAQALADSHGLPPPATVPAADHVAGTAGTAPPPTAPGVPATATSVLVNAVAATAAAARASGNDLAALPAAVATLLLAALHLDADPAVPRPALVSAASAVIGGSAGPLPNRAGPDVPRVAPPPPRLRPPAGRPAAISAPDSAPDTPVTPRPAPVVRPRLAPVAVPAAGFASDFAGSFFLLNAFLAMGLYPDFTRPADSGLALAPSRLLDRLAAQWFGPRYRADRLHLALAAAAADPVLPDVWQVNPAWLHAFDSDDATATTITARHLTQWHANGFPLLDVRRRSRQARAQPAPESRCFRLPRRLPAAAPARWLACLGLYLDARIRRATGDPALGLASLAIPGRCRVTADRIDIDVALDDLPVALRLAGLDRDPGWLPAEGRAIAFHFQ
jgi:hypothetical protein